MNDSITILGSSDGLPSSDRHHASVLVRLAGRTILLDCGEPCSHTLKRMGVSFDSIDALVVTHTHSDHVGGLPMLLQSMWLERRRSPLRLLMPEQAIRPLQQWLRACYLFDEVLGFTIQWRGLTAGKAYRVGQATMKVYRTSHLDSTRARFGPEYPGVGFDAFCVLMQGGGKRIGYSGDVGSAEDLAVLCDQPLDALVVELAHYHPDRLIEFLKTHPIDQVAVTHLGRSVRARLPEVKAQFRRLNPAKLRFAQDGDEISL